MSELKKIDKYILSNPQKALQLCTDNGYNYLGVLLSKILLNNNWNDTQILNCVIKLNNISKKNQLDNLRVLNTVDIVDEKNKELLPDKEKEQKYPLESAEQYELPKKDQEFIISVEDCSKKNMEKEKNKKIRVKLTCNWIPSKELCNLWNKMSKGNFTWNNIQIVWEDPCDYIVVINSPFENYEPEPNKTIIFHMEPRIEERKELWGKWAFPDEEKYLAVLNHRKAYNNIEWHLNRNYEELCNELIIKNPKCENILSAVLSEKYKDPGHMKRIDFMKYIEERGGINTHVYGNNKFQWKNFEGKLPPYEKDNALYPYKYTFNAENNCERNYFSEKFVDAILSECLIFYWGCPNLTDYFDSRAFVQLGLEDFENDYQIIQTAIRENWWEKRLVYIKKAKAKILKEMSFFPRLEKIISEF